ncbi:hypothetical protein OAT38_00530 [Amylibacter sp.]|jgi:hypothetical protein|nr:hypothetical protein [Amylibacter sp.]
MKKQLLQAALMHFKSLGSRAEVNLEIYLKGSVGVGEHPDLVEEVVKLTKIITEADESIKYLEKVLLKEENK